eukprot:3390937-Pleurochrysis_carterae.AAC.1
MCDAETIATYGLEVHAAKTILYMGAGHEKRRAEQMRKDVAQTEMQNFERHGVYVEGSKAQLPS